MPELLIELASEELPPSMQRDAPITIAGELEKTLEKMGFDISSDFPHNAFSTPRRIGFAMEISAKSDKSIEHRGPPVHAPKAALEGFIKRFDGKARLVKRETDKGAYYYALMPPPKLKALIVEILPDILERVSWSSSMRWPQSSMRWARPLRAIFCLLDGKPIALEAGGVKSVSVVRGHHIMSPQPFRVKNFRDYKEKMKKSHLIISPEEREERIRKDIQKRARSLDLLSDDIDEELLRETVGLTESPTVLVGKIDEEYRGLGGEVLRQTLKAHQKCFALRDRNGEIAYFLMVADVKPSDKGKAIIAGNEEVVRARLADADFFMRRDMEKGMDALREESEKIIFHERLGTMKDKAARLEKLVQNPRLRENYQRGAYPLETLKRAAHYSKADLASEMVADMPALQGVMGGIYLRKKREADRRAALAIAGQYSPAAESEAASLLAMCDRMDTLAGFFLIGETPTGSKDPFALRRAGQGILQIIFEVKLFSEDIDLLPIFTDALSQYGGVNPERREDSRGAFRAFMERLFQDYQLLRNIRRDITLAVMKAQADDKAFQPVLMENRMKALEDFMKEEEGKNLLHAYHRACGILKSEKLINASAASFNLAALKLPAEKELGKHLIPERVKELNSSLQSHKIREALAFLADLKKPVDDFFDDVLVLDPDPKIRANRLALLATLRGAMNAIADFSLILEEE